MSPLDPGQVRALEEHLRAVEARTGAQIVVAALDRADAYHGLRWRAYAFGSALAGAAVALSAAVAPRGLPSGLAVLPAVTAVLGVGLTLALAATLVPAVERLFLEPGRAEREVRRRAGALFLERELFATRDRTGLLLLACGFERRAAVRADAGFRGRVSPEEWRGVEDAAAAPLRGGRTAEALEAGLAEVERLLVAKGFTPQAGGANELPDAPVTGRGT